MRRRASCLRLSTNMDTLVAVGTLSAFTYSVWSLVHGGDIYFDTSAVVIAFLLLGRSLEARAKGSASQAIRKLLAMGAREARVLRDGVEVVVPAAEVAVGDLLRVRPGERVAADGDVVEGSSAVDESMLSGESVPVEKVPGDRVAGGTIVADGVLLVRATAVGADTALAQIARLVAKAQESRAPVQRLADRIAGVFTPVVLGIAAATAVGWLIATGDGSKALLAAVAVLIVSCPCAMGLATPAAIMVGTGRGAQLGILIRGGEVLERSRRIDVVVFDKTGTLTEGRMRLVDVAGDPRTLELAAAAEAGSEHPIARAVVDGARDRGRVAGPGPGVSRAPRKRGPRDGGRRDRGRRAPEPARGAGVRDPGRPRGGRGPVPGRRRTVFWVGWAARRAASWPSPTS